MTPERWEQVRQIFDAAQECTPDQRGAYLAGVCSGDAELLREVESLLAAPDSGSDFLARITAGHFVAARRPLPERIGRYRIRGQVGEGGMGVVYEAEQEQPRRIVAVKVIKSAFESAALRRRFEAETEALGRLQHPGIAQIYEAGLADWEFGQLPYFAMEFIHGDSLLQYAEKNKLGIRQRMELMGRICDAVQHAHQRGLIHRDLKPGNILVDTTGQPKILDFGVACAADGSSQSARQTVLGELVGTLAYMSPEQVLADPLEIDTRTDVYSLGVILYELLSGRLPYKLGRSLTEASQAIREQEPVLLSSINRDFRGDMETIVNKALEKDKVQRYRSAASLADDIRRFLGDAPILARSPSATYQIGKFARRHRVLVGASVTVLIVVAAGVVTSTREAVRANRSERSAVLLRDRATDAEQAARKERDRAVNQEQIATVERNRAVVAEGRAIQDRNRAIAEKRRADDEANTAKAVRDFLQNDLLSQASAASQALPNSKPDPDIKVRTALDRAAARLSGKFGRQPLVEASIRQTLAETYEALGLYPEAQQQVERALELRRRERGENDPDTLKTAYTLAWLYFDQGNYKQAEDLYTRVVDKQRHILGTAHPDTLASMSDLGIVYQNLGQLPKAETLFVSVLESNRKLLPKDHPDTLNSMNNLAVLYSQSGKYPQAERLYTEALETQRRVLGNEHPATLLNGNNLAILHQKQGKYPEAEALLESVFETRKRILGADHPETLRSMDDLALLYRVEGKYSLAEPLQRKALETNRRVLGEEHPNTLVSMNNTAVLYRALGKYGEAEAVSLRVWEIQRRRLGNEHPDTLVSMSNLANLYREQGKYDEAGSLVTKCLEIRGRVLGLEHQDTLASTNSLATLYRDQGKYEQAEGLLHKLMETATRVLGPDHPLTLTAMTNLAALYSAQERYLQAEPLLFNVLEARRRRLGSGHPDTIDTIDLLGEVLMKANKFTGAAQILREALNNQSTESWRKYYSQSLLGASLAGERQFSEAEPFLVSGDRKSVV